MVFSAKKVPLRPPSTFLDLCFSSLFLHMGCLLKCPAFRVLIPYICVEPEDVRFYSQGDSEAYQGPHLRNTLFYKIIEQPYFLNP